MGMRKQETGVGGREVGVRSENRAGSGSPSAGTGCRRRVNKEIFRKKHLTGCRLGLDIKYYRHKKYRCTV